MSVVIKYKGLIVLILLLVIIGFTYSVVLHLLNIRVLRLTDLSLHFIAIFVSIFALILMVIVSKASSKTS